MTETQAWKEFVWRGLLKPALDDLRRGRPCGDRCRKELGHCCAEDARRFLRSPWAEVLFDFLGLEQKWALEELGI